MEPRISAIAAIGKNRELGKQNELLWRIPDDLKRVKILTTGHPIIMGRKTYDSIGRPLPNRTNIVVSRSTNEIPDCVVCSDVSKAIEHARSVETEEIFIFGGAQIYEAAWEHVERLYLTIIDATDDEADVFFPDYSAFTQVLEQTNHQTEDGLPYSHVTLEK